MFPVSLGLSAEPCTVDAAMGLIDINQECVAHAEMNASRQVPRSDGMTYGEAEMTKPLGKIQRSDRDDPNRLDLWILGTHAYNLNIMPPLGEKMR
jgi:hypothetical protein